MDFLEGIGGGIDIQDMIECDIKSEFGDHHKPLINGDPMVSQPLMIPININLPADFGASLHNGLISDHLSAHLESDIKTEQDFSWLQTVNTSEIQNVEYKQERISPENTDPNLMVNPQTGLPVSLSNNTTQTAPEPQNTAQITINGAIANALLQQAQQETTTTRTPTQTATIQYVNISNTLPNVVVPQGYTIVSQPNTTTIQAAQQPAQTVQSNQNYQQHQTLTQHLLSTNNNQQKIPVNKNVTLEKTYPKPAYSYSCLIAMALKNSDTGALPVSEIYSFMTENFPYFKTAPDGWKNSVRHNLSLNKCFEKIENPRANGNTRKGCLWGLNPLKIEKMEEEIVKWRKKDTPAVKRSMSRPEKLELLEKGNIGSHSPRHPNNIRNGFSIQIPSPETPCSVELQSPAIDVTADDSSSSSEDESNPLPSFTQQAAAAAAASSNTNTTQGNPMQGGVEVSLIEVEPNVLSEEPMKHEDSPPPQPMVVSLRNVPSFGSTNGTIKQECININSMDTDGPGIAVDPTFSDLSISQSLWDELSGEGINLEDIPISAGFSLSFTPNSLTSSPATVQSTTGIQCM